MTAKGRVCKSDLCTRKFFKSSNHSSKVFSYSLLSTRPLFLDGRYHYERIRLKGQLLFEEQEDEDALTPTFF